MDPRALLHQSPPSPQETPPSSSRSGPEQYEPPPASSSSASASDVPLAPPSPPPPPPCIKIGRTSEEVRTGEATVTDDNTMATDDDSTINNEAPAQDHTHSSARSAAPTTISSPPLSSGVVADAWPSIFWRFVLPMRNPNPALPVTNPPPVTNPQPVTHSNFRRFKEWHKSCQEQLMPDGVIQVRIAVCGFAFYGIMALLGNTWDLIKKFPENFKVLVLFLIGLIWVTATVAVPLTMSARTRLGKASSQHATRLVLLGTTLHMLFNVSLMLPKNLWMESKKNMNLWSLVASLILLVLAIIGHGVSWIQSSIYGEVEEKPTEESGNHTASS